MKVLFLTDHSLSWNESPPSRLLHLSHEVSKSGHAVRVLGAHSAETVDLSKIDVITLTYYSANNFIEKLIFPFNKVIRKNIQWCDALVVRGYWIGLISLLYAAIAGVKVRIYDFHGFAWKEQYGEGRIMRSISTYLIELLILPLSSKMLAVSQGVKKDLPLFSERKVVVVENGVDIEEFRTTPSSRKIDELKDRFNISDKKPVFGIVASFGPWIDIRCVIEAAQLLQDEAEIILIGSGPGIDIANREIESHNIENIHVAGTVKHEDLVCILKDLFYGCLCPYEGQWIHSNTPNFFASRKVKEYLASGKPIIVSDVKGRGDFLIDGETCVTYTSGDSFELAQKIMHVVGEPDLKNRIGKNGREIADNFSWEKICKESGLLTMF